MEEGIIQKYYNDYLKECFDLDSLEYQDRCYIIRFSDTKSFFVNPKKGKVDCYYEIRAFHEGYAAVRGPEGYNYINQEGELLSKEWFTDAVNFKNGYGQVVKGLTDNFIAGDGSFFFPKFQTDMAARICENGAAVVYYGGKNPIVINAQKKKLYSHKFQLIHNFIGKNAVAIRDAKSLLSKKSYLENNNEYHIINCDGNDLKTDFIYLEQVDENIFVAHEIFKSYLINEKGERIGKNYFDEHYQGFIEGYMLVKTDGYYNLIGKDGEFVFEKGFDSLTPPNNGICKVGTRDNESQKYNYYDIVNKRFISTYWFKEAGEFYNGMAIVGNNKYRILYLDGSLSKKKFDTYEEAEAYISKMEEEKEREEWLNNPIKELRQVKDKDTINYMFPDGSLLFAKPEGVISPLSKGVFAHYNDDILSIYNKFGKKVATLSDFPHIEDVEYLSIEAVSRIQPTRIINSTKGWFYYNYEADGKTYSLDYKPVVDYGDIIICEDDGNYYKFEKAMLTMTLLGRKSEISLRANYIIIGDKKYVISGRDFIDVTELPFTETIEMKAGVRAVKTYEEFKIMFQSPEYQAKIESEMAHIKEAIEAEKRNRLIEEAKEKEEEEQRLLDEKKNNLRQSLNSLSDILRECSKYITEIQGQISSNSYKKIMVPEELLLIEVDDHLEINPVFLNVIKFVDLSCISFKNVKVNGIDLSYTNASINPQEVYNKDMSAGKYCGLDFNFCSFDGVNVENADFKGAIVDFAQCAEEVKKGL